MKKIILIFFLFNIQFSFSENKKAATLIEKGIEYLHANNFEKAIQTFNESQELINKTYSYQEQFLIYNNLGLIYYKMSELKEATRYFELAFKLAKDEKKAENEMTVLNNLAILFIKIGNYETAKNYLEQALNIAEQENDINKLAIYSTNLASVNYELKDYETCRKNLQKIEKIDLSKVLTRVVISYKILSNNLLIHDGKIDIGISNLEKLLKECKNETYYDERLKIYFSLILAYQIKQDYNKCQYYFDLGFKQNLSPEMKKDFFMQISKVYFDKQEYDKAIQAKDSVIKYNDIIQKNINKESIENARLNFELIKSNYEIENQKEQLQKDRKFYTVIIIIFIVACLLGVFLINKKNQNNKQKNLLIHQNLLIKEYEFNNLLDSKESLQKELLSLKNNEEKKEEISNELVQEYQEKSKIRNQIFEKKLLLQITKNELLSELLDEIVNKKTEFNPEKTFEIIQKLRIHIKEELNFVEDVYKNDFEKDHFIVSLLKKHPSLNTNDIRLITLIYLQTDTKEIAQLLYITPETVRKRKERLKQKLELDKTIDLYQYLVQIA